MPSHELHGRIGEPLELDPEQSYGYQPAFQEQPPSEVGEHSEGASSSGVEDVLLSSGELLSSSPISQVAPCVGEGRQCIVYGFIPGAIDAVRPAFKLLDSAKQATDSAEMSSRSEDAYGFRCVWVEGQ